MSRTPIKVVDATYKAFRLTPYGLRDGQRVLRKRHRFVGGRAEARTVLHP